jgi:hypothetical protein
MHYINESLYLYISLYILMGMGFELREKQALYHLSHSFCPFCSGYFGGGVSRTVRLGWPPTMVLLISASQVAGITDVSYWHPADIPSI